MSVTEVRGLMYGIYNLLTNNSEKTLCASVCVVKEEGWGGWRGKEKA